MSKSAYVISYIKNNVRRFEIKLSRKNDAELISWLESKENVNDYIKKLIAQDKKGGTE